MTTETMAQVFTVCAAGAACFQLALALGAPWGRLTWGGRFPGRLPGRMRAVAMCSAVVLVVFAVIVDVRAGLVAAAWQPRSRTLIWIVVGYCALGIVANTITPSRRERMLWLPVVLAMWLTSLAVAMR